MIQNALSQLLDGKDLSRDDSRRVMDTIMSGEATPAQIGGFLVALRLKGETAAEIAGAAEAMRSHVVAVQPKRDDLVGRYAAIITTHDGHVTRVEEHPHLAAALEAAGIEDE